MICEMEVLDPSGHVTLQWDPDDPESVKKAEAEFERLRAAGFAFFASASVDADEVDELDANVGSLDGRLQQLAQVKRFNKRARRTAAVPPMRGG
jgi:hypothetical protein